MSSNQHAMFQALGASPDLRCGSLTSTAQVKRQKRHLHGSGGGQKEELAKTAVVEDVIW